MLSELLEARHPDWEIINAGVAGYGTDQVILLLEEQGRALHPDVVLYLFHPNDVEDNNDDSRYGYHKPRFLPAAGAPDGLELTNVPVPGTHWRKRLERWLAHNTFVLYTLWNGPEILADWWASLRGGEPAPAEATKRPEAPPAAAEVAAPPAGPRTEAARPRDVPFENVPPGRDWDLTVSRLLVRKLAREVDAMGARLVVVSVPGAPDPRTLLEPLLAELGVPYLPLDEAFRGLPREAFKFEHDPHWNAGGQRIAADATERFLEEQGIFRKAAGP